MAVTRKLDRVGKPGRDRKPIVYWYWPFSREENSGLPRFFAAHSGTALVVSTVDREGAWTPELIPGAAVKIALRDVNRSRLNRVLWALNRLSVFTQRWRRRSIEVRSANPPIVHIWYPTLIIDNIDVRRWRATRRVVLHVHDVIPHRRRLPEGLSNWLRSDLYRAATGITVYHASLKEMLVEGFGVDPRRVSVIPMIMPDAEHSLRLRDTHLGRPVSFLLFGTIRKNKGLDVALRAMQRLPNDQSVVRLVIAGKIENSELLQSLEPFVNDARIEVHNTWLSWVDKQRFFRQADVLLLPYTSFASQSAVLHDAHAFGLPIVASDVGALGDSVRSTGSGWVIQPDSATALSRAMADALANADRRKSFGARSRAVAEAHSPSAITGALLAAYGLSQPDPVVDAVSLPRHAK